MSRRGDAPAAWFFDLGGTLLRIEDDEIAVDSEGQVSPLPGVAARLAAMRDQAIFVISNQAGVAEGTLARTEADGFVQQLNGLSDNAITDWKFCFHAREAYCACRKPKPGLILALARRHQIALPECVMIGDSQNDRKAAAAAGIGRFIWAAEYFDWPEG